MKHRDTLCYSDTPTFISITGACDSTIAHSVFSLMAGLIVEMLRNGLKISEYEEQILH